jgi:hypothetical protein
VEIMKASNLLPGAIWVLVVGGNVLNTFTISPQVFLEGPQLPWQIAFLPVVVIFGAFMARDFPGERTLGKAVDQRLGSGSYRKFMQSLQPELMFSAMCFGIVVSGLARSLLLGTAAFPPTILGFFASGCVAFLLAHFIRRRREAV